MKIGITEAGDAGLDFSWTETEYLANIIISKNLNDKLIENLIKHKEHVIFHMTCTGFGGTKIEPNAPNVDYTYNQVLKLINNGFPINQIVLRIDPIICNKSGTQKLELVLEMFKNVGIKRVRYSFLDMYNHVKERFKNAAISLPYITFAPPNYAIEKIMQILNKYKDIYEFESCAENTQHKIGCISNKDLNILGINQTELNIGGFQRPNCSCICGKTELLTGKRRCAHQCLYCYWKD